MPTAATLSQPVASQLLTGLMALRQGDFSHRLPSDLDGLEGKLADTFNDVIDIVLMDIRLPDMDGYDTMRAIRGIPRFRSLPIVAVTATAMKGDREKCIDAGAWDSLPKPVASDQLLSVFRTWLHR